MIEHMPKVPVLLLIYNRVDTALTVLEQIKNYKPEILYIASDGPRKEKKDEESIVLKVRNSVLEYIDWECQIETFFREENVGCGIAVHEAINWFFLMNEYGIILEDDCLPLSGFFEFCEEILHKYRNDHRIFEVCGTNLQGGIVRGNDSYYFSRFSSIWGWGTWSRAWKKYDYKMKNYKSFKLSKGIERIFSKSYQVKYWYNLFEGSNKIDTWDYQWQFTIWDNMGVVVVPNVNLIKNIGFNSSGTHTKKAPGWYYKLINSQKIIIPIKHPSDQRVNEKADQFLFNRARKIPKIIHLIGVLNKTFSKLLPSKI